MCLITYCYICYFCKEFGFKYLFWVNKIYSSLHRTEILNHIRTRDIRVKQVDNFKHWGEILNKYGTNSEETSRGICKGILIVISCLNPLFCDKYKYLETKSALER